LSDLEKRIKELEMAWDFYDKNRNSRKYPMPDLIELSKLKQQLEKNG